jgi:hypothetical protein
LKHSSALGHFYQREVQCFGNGGEGQLAIEHGLHGLKPVLSSQLLAAGHAGASASVQAGEYVGFLSEPL